MSDIEALLNRYASARGTDGPYVVADRLALTMKRSRGYTLESLATEDIWHGPDGTMMTAAEMVEVGYDDYRNCPGSIWGPTANWGATHVDKTRLVVARRVLEAVVTLAAWEAYQRPFEWFGRRWEFPGEKADMRAAGGVR